MKRTVAICWAMLLLGTAAWAQTSKPKPPMTVAEAIRHLADSGRVWGMPESPEQAAVTMRSFSRCVMGNPKEAGRMLSTVPGSNEEVILASQIAAKHSGCLDAGSLRFGTLLLRGTIAEGMLRRDFGVIGASPHRSLVAIYLMPVAAERQSLASRVRAALQLQDMALCLVKRSPDKAAALLATQPATNDEAAQWKQLSADLNACIDPTQSVRISKLQLRGTLAEAGYRLSAQASGTGKS